MEVIVGKTAGFCYGVKNAVEKTELELDQSCNVCCLGELVHNSKVVNNLKEKGLVVIDELSQNTGKLKTIIRAHGVCKKVYEDAESSGIELIDLTCPNVLKIHKIVSDYQNNKYFIIVIGNKNHPETIGTIGFCGENYEVIENEDDIENAILELQKSNLKKILVVVQTTFSVEKFNEYVNSIQHRLLNDYQIEVINTICNATKIRQEETAKISKEVDHMIIIGGKNSSNTKKLYEISKMYCENTVCIEDGSELDISQIKSAEKVGIMAGASTPQSSIDDVKKMLKNT